MKTIRSEIQTKLDAGAIELVPCLRIELTNGTTFYMTDFIEDLVIGANTYLSTAGYTSSAITQTTSIRADVVDVEGILNIAGINAADFEAGLFDNASLFFFFTDYTDPVEDDIRMQSGFLGRVRLMDNQYVVEFVSLSERLKQNIGRSYNVKCDTELGSSVCGITLQPNVWTASTVVSVRQSMDALTGSKVRPSVQNGFFFECTTAGTTGVSEPSWNAVDGATTTDNTAVWTARTAFTLTGSITALTSQTILIDSTKTQPNQWWRAGIIEFTSGLASGFRMEIKDSLNTGQIELQLPLPREIAVSDTFTVVTGCEKRIDQDCIAKFRNSTNHQGFPYVPTPETAAKIGGQ